MKSLTSEEKAKLNNFIGSAVYNNIAFPPMAMGGANITVQDIFHNRTIQSLERYADFLEKADSSLSRTEKRNNLTSRTITASTGVTVSYKEIIDFIDLVIKDKLYNAYVTQRDERIKALETKLKGTLSKKEVKAQLEAELLELKKEVSST